MPITSFPPVILMYSLYHFSPQGGYHLVTFKLRGTAHPFESFNVHLRKMLEQFPLGYYPITNRLRHVTFTHHSTLGIRFCHLPESATCDRIGSVPRGLHIAAICLKGATPQHGTTT